MLREYLKKRLSIKILGLTNLELNQKTINYFESSHIKSFLRNIQFFLFKGESKIKNALIINV